MRVETPWRKRLAQSLATSSELNSAKFFQLATLSANKKIQNRTLVFRGFLNNSDTLVIATDKRSSKLNDLQYANDAQICWYFTKTREQYRLSASTDVISLDNCLAHSNTINDNALHLQKYWKQLSSKAKQQFDWPMPRSIKEKYSESNGNEDDTTQLFTSTSSIEVSENFCLLLLTPYECDYLSLNQAPHLSVHSSVNQKWAEVILNP